VNPPPNNQIPNLNLTKSNAPKGNYSVTITPLCLANQSLQKEMKKMSEEPTKEQTEQTRIK